MKRERRMNPKCLGRSVPDTFDAKSADFTGLKTRRITRAVSFDYLVGAGEERRRHFEAERLGGFSVDHQLEFGRLLDWKIGRLCAFEDFVDVAGGAVNQVGCICPIGDESARFHIFVKSLKRRQLFGEWDV